MRRSSFSAFIVSALMPLTLQAQQETGTQEGTASDSAPVLISDVTWSHSFQRGLPVHDLEGPGASLQLVCDPDRVFGPQPNGSFAVSLPQERAPARIVVLAQTGEQAAFELEDGRALQTKADPEAWATLVAILGSSTEFAVVSAHDAVTWNVSEVLAGPCE
ncbi:hypothetical protein [Salipiger sp.]|uniref:hypothetical protein n=1 Tax=Salipiger sp. TaxID=2078585 RepID=UPI003A9829FA